MKFTGLFLLLYPTFIPITYGRNMIRKNSLFFSSFAIFVVISSPISTSYCVLHLLPKSTNRLRYSLRIFYSSRHPRDRCDSFLDKKPSHVCLPVYIPCAMCKSCTLYVRVVAYMRDSSQCIFTREARLLDPTASLINLQERAFREINILSTAPASSSSARLNRPALLSLFPSRLDGSALRERKPEDEDDKDDGILSNRTRRISRGDAVVTGEWMNRGRIELRSENHAIKSRRA